MSSGSASFQASISAREPQVVEWTICGMKQPERIRSPNCASHANLLLRVAPTLA
jgi:hypothetical protein